MDVPRLRTYDLQIIATIRSAQEFKSSAGMRKRMGRCSAGAGPTSKGLALTGGLRNLPHRIMPDGTKLGRAARSG
jgi:hypothetical protein